MASSIFLLSSWCVLGAAGNAGGYVDSAAASHSMRLAGMTAEAAFERFKV